MVDSLPISLTASLRPKSDDPAEGFASFFRQLAVILQSGVPLRGIAAHR